MYEACIPQCYRVCTRSLLVLSLAESAQELVFNLLSSSVCSHLNKTVSNQDRGNILVSRDSDVPHARAVQMIAHYLAWNRIPGEH